MVLIRFFQERKQRAIENERKKSFRLCFSFESGCLSERKYKKEALIRLSFIAADMLASARAVCGNPTNDILQYRYQGKLEHYQKAIALLRHFDELFAESIPHWSELPLFLKRWLAVGPIDSDKDAVVANIGTETALLA
jgi:hypothetical protein